MAAWTFYSCGNCKKRITTEAHDTFYLIGVPYLKCERCGTVNDRSSRRNEWDLMLWPMRVGVYATAAFFGIIIGAGSATTLLAVGAQVFGFSARVTGTLWVVLAIIGAAMGVKLCWQRGAKSAIRESRERLANVPYVETLLRLGFACGSPGQGVQRSPQRAVSLGARLGHLALAALLVLVCIRAVQIWSRL
jgi:hypothetical protein